jgi:hypothetical protein
VRLFTVTAPGADVLPWKNGRINELDAWRWNADMWRMWPLMRRQAAQYAGRHVKGQRSGLLVVVPELQKRGVLHLHVVMGATTPLERRWCEAFVRYCRQHGRRYGFGRVDFGAKYGWQEASDAVGQYAAKLGGYVAKVGGLRAMWEGGELPSRCFYVARRLTSVTGLTMRASRMRSRWRRATGQWLTLPQLRDLVELVDAGWRPVQLRT